MASNVATVSQSHLGRRLALREAPSPKRNPKRSRDVQLALAGQADADSGSLIGTCWRCLRMQSWMSMTFEAKMQSLGIRPLLLKLVRSFVAGVPVCGGSKVLPVHQRFGLECQSSAEGLRDPRTHRPRSY